MDRWLGQPLLPGGAAGTLLIPKASALHREPAGMAALQVAGWRARGPRWADSQSWVLGSVLAQAGLLRVFKAGDVQHGPNPGHVPLTGDYEHVFQILLPQKLTSLTQGCWAAFLSLANAQQEQLGGKDLWWWTTLGSRSAALGPGEAEPPGGKAGRREAAGDQGQTHPAGLAPMTHLPPWDPLTSQGMPRSRHREALALVVFSSQHSVNACGQAILSETLIGTCTDHLW